MTSDQFPMTNHMESPKNQAAMTIQGGKPEASSGHWAFEL
jgi:hypothetical protein